LCPIPSQLNPQLNPVYPWHPISLTYTVILPSLLHASLSSVLSLTSVPGKYIVALKRRKCSNVCYIIHSSRFSVTVTFGEKGHLWIPALSFPSVHSLSLPSVRPSYNLQQFILKYPHPFQRETEFNLCMKYEMKLQLCRPVVVLKCMFYLLKDALCRMHLSLLLCVTSIIDEKLYLKSVTLVRYKPVYKLS